MTSRPRIIFLVQTPFTQRDWRRNAIGWLDRLGYDVLVIDVAALAMPIVAPAPEPPPEFPGMRHLVVRDRRQWAQHKGVLASAALIVCLVGSGFVSPDNLPVLRAVAASRKPSLLLSINALPVWQAASRTRTWRDLVDRVQRTNPQLFLLKRLPLRLLGVRPTDFVVYGGARSVTPRRLVTPETHAIRAHAMDFDLALEHMAASAAPSARTAVYIDQYIGFHPDAQAMGFEQPEDPDHFYPLLCRFFDRVEAELGLEVVIAAHPRADYDAHPGLFGNRRLLNGDTCSLVAESSLVIASYSAAVGFAPMFGKPVVLVATKRLLRDCHTGVSIRSLAQALGLPMAVLDEGEPALPDSLMNEQAFARYIDDYIKWPGSPARPLWHIVVDELCRLGVLPIDSQGRITGTEAPQ